MCKFITTTTVGAVIVIYRVNFIVLTVKNFFVAKNFKKNLKLNTAYLNIL